MVEMKKESNELQTKDIEKKEELHDVEKKEESKDVQNKEVVKDELETKEKEVQKKEATNP